MNNLRLAVVVAARLQGTAATTITTTSLPSRSLMLSKGIGMLKSVVNDNYLNPNCNRGNVQVVALLFS
jgi:hypothetical protein